MNLFLYFIFLLLPIVGLVFIYKKREQPENNLALKMIGYYLLGAFSFSFNNLVLPLGFIIFLLAFRPVVNKKVKQMAAYLGLGIFILNLLTPPIHNFFFELPRKVVGIENNLFSAQLLPNWEKVQDEFEMDPQAKLQNLEMEYSQDGQINQMNFEVVSNESGGFVYYRFTYEPDKQQYTVKRQRLPEPWIQYEQLVPVSRLFSLLETLDVKKLSPENEYPWYYLRSEGTREPYAVLEGKKYVLSNEERIEVKNYELPIEGFIIRTCGKEKIAEEAPLGSDCKERIALFYDATYEPKEKGPFTKDEADAILRGNDTFNTWMDSHIGSKIEEERNGKYYIKRQGEWQEVPEERFMTKVEPFEIEYNLVDNKWNITYKALFGDPPYFFEGIVDKDTGEILSTSTSNN